MSQSSKERQRTRKERGLCCSCRNKTLPEKSRCQLCTNKAKQRYRDKTKKTYNKRKVAKLCVACEKPSTSGVYCQECLDAQRGRQGDRAALTSSRKAEQQQRATKERTERNVCVTCENPELFRNEECRLCWARRQARDGTSHYDARKAAGLCQNCDAFVTGGAARCTACQQKRQATTKRRVEKGICPNCGKSNDNKGFYCDRCREKQKDTARDREQNQLCTGCGKVPPTDDNKTCQSCTNKNRKKSRKKHKNLRQQVLDAYGNKCACCGEKTPAFLQIDHTNNDGAKHRRQLGGAGGLRLYTWLRKHNFPQAGFQLLCANCNFAKGHYGTCPHAAQKED